MSHLISQELGLHVTVSSQGEPTRSVVVTRFPCRIGRDRNADIVLSGWRIARLHAQVDLLEGALQIIDSGSRAGVFVNGERLSASAPITSADRIDIASYRLQVSLRPGSGRPIGSDEGRADHAVSPASALEIHSLAQMGPNGAAGPGWDEDPQPPTEQGVSAGQEALAWRRRLHRDVLQVLDLRRQDLRQARPEVLRTEMRLALEQLLTQSEPLPPQLMPEKLIAEVLDEALGLGVLEPLLKDASVSEIMINAPDDVWIERQGRLERHAGGFSDADAVRSIIDRIVAPLGRRIDESSPMVDARLPDGSRLNAVIPPVALRGPAVTIRRFSKRLLHPEDLIKVGAASESMMAFLSVCVEHRRNIVISGGTSSGKTTLLNVLANLIPPGERIITIEDAAELSLRHPHLVCLEGRPGNLEQRGEVSIRDLVRNALRMRPDRIVVGECRGGESLDMLQAMNTGHDGSLTTVHANSPRDVISRLEVMTLMAGMDLPVVAIREQIAAAIDLVVHQARFADGSRRITAITEVTGIESGRVQMQPLFVFRQIGERRGASIQGVFEGCQTVPGFYEELSRSGASLDLTPFASGYPAPEGAAR